MPPTVKLTTPLRCAGAGPYTRTSEIACSLAVASAVSACSCSRTACHPDAAQIVARRGEANGVAHVRRARLELVREHVPRRALVADELDHVAARLIRRHRLEQRAPAHETADAHRAEHLVAAERVEVDAERIEIEREVRRGLRAVAHDHRAGAPRDRA